MTDLALLAAWATCGLLPVAASLRHDPPRGWRSGPTTDGWCAVLMVFLPLAAALGPLVIVGQLVARWAQRGRT